MVGYNSMWVPASEDPRSQDNPEGELATYRAYLTNYRHTLRMKCDGLDAEQLARTSVPPSSMSLLGLVRHMARVEHWWFQMVLGEDLTLSRPYDEAEDADFDGALADPEVVSEAFARWQAEIAAADAWLDAVDETDLGRLVPTRRGGAIVRDVLVHMIEEYARHCGHADLLRECVDGRTGQ